jgi:hypothetical protein
VRGVNTWSRDLNVSMSSVPNTIERRSMYG